MMRAARRVAGGPVVIGAVSAALDYFFFAAIALFAN